MSFSLPIVELSGAPRTQGRAHGETLREPIARVRERWRDSLSRRFGIHPDTFIETFLAETRFVDAMRRWTPRLLEEVEGIAEGSGRPLAETLAFQFMDEEWWFGTMRYARKRENPNHCSVIACRGRAGAPPILAQNMDLRAYHDGGQAMIVVSGNGAPRAAILTICGMIGLCGANDLGVGVAVNTLWQLPSAAGGLPVACVMREILARRDVAEASEWIRTPPHASGQHYMIGDPASFASFEASASLIKAMPWPHSSPSYVHTNHPLESGKIRRDEENSRNRYATLCELSSGKALTLDEVKSALSVSAGSDPISVRPKADDPTSAMTFASIVMELRRPPAIEVAAGPPCSNPYRAIA